jgi:hypothetical protein
LSATLTSRLSFKTSCPWMTPGPDKYPRRGWQPSLGKPGKPRASGNGGWRGTQRRALGAQPLARRQSTAWGDLGKGLGDAERVCKGKP